MIISIFITGAKTDIRDNNGLTPLYYSILHKSDLKITQLLLNFNRPIAQGPNFPIGCRDQQGWQEVHQACKLGLEAHLEKLLYHGCDINAKIEGSGNTPLHVAAINDQLECAKVLMLRGAEKELTNSSHQTAHQVAVVAQNMDLAEFIAEFNSSNIVLFRDRPANYLDMAALTGTKQQQHQQPQQRTSALVHPLPQLSQPLSLDLSGGASSAASSTGQLPLCGPNQLQLQQQQSGSNISPCLSQRSLGTHSNATTSSSGVCCGGGGGGELGELNKGVTIVSIQNKPASFNQPFKPVDEETQDNIIGSSCDSHDLEHLTAQSDEERGQLAEQQRNVLAHLRPRAAPVRREPR